MMKRRILSFGILVALIAAVVACGEKPATPAEVIKSQRYEHFFDQRSRLKAKLSDRSDTRDFLEILFVVWLTDRDSFNLFCQFGHSHLKDLKMKLAEDLESNDALQIGKYGKIDMAVSRDRIFFYGPGDSGSSVRLRVLDRLASGRSDGDLGKGYTYLNQEFTKDILANFTFGHSTRGRGSEK